MNAPIRFSRMSHLLFCFGLLAIAIPVLALRTVHNTPPDPTVVAADPNVRTVANANTDFGFRLLAELNQETPDKNIFFSPFSVSNCLTMVLNGAGGETQTAMTSTLGLQWMTLGQINQANGLLLPSLENSDPNVAISVANALWANTGTTFDPSFQQRCGTCYDAHTETLDFRSPTATDTINGWVKDNTAGKVGNLVTPADLKQATAVLTNAVYFDGTWMERFHREDTHNGPFTLASGHTKTVSLMAHNGFYKYTETPRFQAVSLPYGDGRMSLVVFLPKPGSTLNDFLKGLNGTTWTQWITQMKSAPMTIVLPRFKADYTTKLNAPLTALGMRSAFDSTADFSPMGLPGSAISKVIHKAILQVDENGTEAAAATGTVMQLGGEVPPKFAMRVDRPFFMAIRDNTTGAVLFAGVLREPN